MLRLPSQIQGCPLLSRQRAAYPGPGLPAASPTGSCLQPNASEELPSPPFKNISEKIYSEQPLPACHCSSTPRPRLLLPTRPPL